MKYYCVAEIEVISRDWVPSYIENVTKLVERFGGKYLARTPHIERLEGEGKSPQIFLIIEWPSRESALAFYESEEYRPYRQSRMEGARTELILAAGEDVTGAAQMAD